ncbi:MAG: tetratricopeptide repeat protein [Bacteroidales bacterium]|nr:tetratricopeptide repeat protein [Bacteroidales bacterium]
MPTTRIVKIFLASSITELEDERIRISDSISQDLTRLFEQDDIFIQFLRSDCIHEGNNSCPDQEKNDEMLRRCDVSLFLFKDKEGKYTIHEYEVARNLQKEKNHKIYVYYLRDGKEKMSNELTPFQEKLKKDNVYWKECDSLSDLKYMFALGLLKDLGVHCGETVRIADEVKKGGDAIFRQYESAEKQQVERRELIHQEIEKLLAQTDPIMKNTDTLISARITQVIGIYQKADLWASKTDYDNAKYIFLLSGYASFLEDYGLYNEAEVIYLRQVSLIEQCYGELHPYVATSYSNIGGLFWHKGEYDKALEYSFKALRIRESLPDTDGRELATTFNNIGTIYDNLGDYQKALEYYNKAFRLVEHQSYAEGRNYAALCNNIGIVYRKIGNLTEALKYLLIALDVSKKVFGKDHPYTASTLNNIGQVYESFGKHDEALKYHEEALWINIENLGVDHPNVGKDYNDIGFVYANMNNYAKALELYKKALKIKHNKLGDEHPDTATCYHNIGYVYYQMKDFEKAVENLSKALITRKRMLGVDHPDTAATKLLVNAVMFAKTFKR